MNLKKTLPMLASALALAALSACSGMPGASMMGMTPSLKLTGDQEVPPVTTAATATGSIKVSADGAVSGSVTTTGLTGTMAHIHAGPVGKNGPVIIPLTQTSEGEWSVPDGARLTEDQLKSYQAGELYVNVHTAANKGGEIRAQLKP